MSVDRVREEATTDVLTPPEPLDIRVVSAPYPFLASPMRPDEIGRLGAYRVLKLLGQGGMAYVFLAEDLHLRRRVALKVMKPAPEDDPAAAARFLREARALASIKHDHVVTVHQVVHDGPAPFLAMEWLRGQTLEDWVADTGPAAGAEALRLAREIAAGLAAVHGNGLVHRDLKPNNLWVEEPGRRVKLLDFGLARGVEDARLTGTGYIIGTPAFMSPEQARGDRLDARSDLFSLGGVLYFLCAGRPPFQAASSVGLLTSVVLDHPQPISDLNPRLPAPLAALVMQLLEKSPERRPASARDVIARLVAAEKGFVPIGDTAPAGRVGAEADMATEQIVPGELLERVRGTRRPRFLAAVALGVTVGLIGVAGWQFGGRADSNEPRPAGGDDQFALAEAAPSGVFVMSTDYMINQGAGPANDSVTLLDGAGAVKFRVPDLNTCDSIGSTHAIATDPARGHVWVAENVAKRIRRLDYTGRVTATIDTLDASAVAVDPKTGNLWVLANTGFIGSGRIAVYGPDAKYIATHAVVGWDIAYDAKAEAFWVAAQSLTKIAAADGKILSTTSLHTYSATSIDADPTTDSLWVAVCNHPDLPNSGTNRLLKFNAAGKEVLSVELGPKHAKKVSVDRVGGGVWVANMGQSAEHYSADGKSVTLHLANVLTVMADPREAAIWIVTPDEVQKINAAGVVTKRTRHAAPPISGAWVALLE